MLYLHSQSLPHYGLDRFFELAKRAGFDGVEIAITENLDTQNPQYLKTLEKRYNLPIKFFSMPPQLEEKVFEAFQTTVREFPRVGVNLAPAQTLSFRYKKWLETIVPKLCAKYDLDLNYRNVFLQLSFGLIPDRVGNSLYALKELGHVCLDISALWSSKQDLMRSVEFLGKALRVVHLSNVNKGVPYSSLTNGIMPLESFLSKLEQIRFDGDFVLRLSAKALHEGSDDRTLEELKSAQQFFEQFFPKTTAPAVAPTPENSTI